MLLRLALATIPLLGPGSASADASGAETALRLLDARGQLLLTAKPRPDGFRFKDARDQTLGEAKVQVDRVKLKDAQDQERWKVKRKEGGAEIEDAGGQRLFRLKGRAGEEWALADAAGATLVRLKPREDGYEARDDGGRTLARARSGKGRVAIEGGSGSPLFELEGTTDARAGIWFALERFTLPERAALCVFFLKVGP